MIVSVFTTYLNNRLFYLLIIIPCLVLPSFLHAQEFVPLYPADTDRNEFDGMATESMRLEDPPPSSMERQYRIYSQVSKPTYTYIAAKKSVNTGIGIIIFPGGGLKEIWYDKEGTDIANWLAEKGISSMIIKYSTSTDAQQNTVVPWNLYIKALKKDSDTAFNIFQEKSSQWNVDPEKIGMLGFSAGAWIAYWHTIHPTAEDYCCVVTEKNRPRFVGLIYGTGRGYKIDYLENSKELPPFYLVVARDDPYFDDSNRQSFYTILKHAPKSELHVYGQGGHGFGRGKNRSSSSLWLQNFLLWLRDLELIETLNR